MTAKLPPKAPKIPFRQTHHGITREDPYQWLKAENWQAVMHDPAVLPADIRAYLEAENDYLTGAMADTEAMQNTLFAEMKGRIREDDTSVPAPHGPWVYSTAFVTGGQYPLYERTPRDGGLKQVMFDGNAMAADKDYFRYGYGVSPDHRLADWAADDNGSEFYTIRVRDLESGKDLDDVLEKTSGGAVWAADGQSFFYTEQDDNHRPLKTWHHLLGTRQGEDRLIYEETNPGLFTGVHHTASEQFIVLSSHDHDSSEARIIPADAPFMPPLLIAARQENVEYDVEHWDDRFIFKTNRDGAEDYKIMWAPMDRPGPENWQDLIPHRPGVFIVSVLMFARHMVRMERENALPRIVIRDMATEEEHQIAFDEEAYSLGFGDMREFDTDTLRFTYSSPTTPARVYDYDMVTRERVLRKEQEVPSGHDPSDYVARRVFAPAHDGESIPVTLLHRKTTPLDGSAPLWLYGYGSYGMSMPAAFNTNVLSLVDRGFVYAIAHVRGGQEKGRRWYKLGKLEHKANSFRDFIAAGEYLAREKFTARGNIVAQGGSAGGMLMGAVANMAPDLFRAIVAEVPFVDVLTTMLDDTLPLTPPEWPEWGNPIADAAAYGTIAAYSPYDNVGAHAYPAILAVAGLTDPRVTYWEPAKWVAKLRDRRSDDGLTLLKTNMGAGHGGASGRFDRLKEVALVYAFGLKMAGKQDAA